MLLLKNSKNGDIDKMNFDNIKVAIFDFDDTLAIHNNKNYSEYRKQDEENFLNYYLNAYLNPEKFYENIEPCVKSDSLLNLINTLRDKGVKIYCLSGMKFSFHLKAKQNFINKHYGCDIEVISTQSQERKLDAIKIIQRINNCSLEEILFVDDMEENVIKFKNLGICALLPSEIKFIK